MQYPLGFGLLLHCLPGRAAAATLLRRIVTGDIPQLAAAVGVSDRSGTYIIPQTEGDGRYSPQAKCLRNDLPRAQCMAPLLFRMHKTPPFTDRLVSGISTEFVFIGPQQWSGRGSPGMLQAERLTAPWLLA